jgi:S-adenosylmethionine decarboxylase proenzyme
VATPPPAAIGTEHPSEDIAHPFTGRHLVISYLGCDAIALSDHQGLIWAMGAAVKASGAQLLKTCEHPFSEGGFTAVMLLSESHASIHTYPEVGACFVDLFTCGYTCKAEKFDAVLRAYLQPQEAGARVLLRSREVVDDPLDAFGRPSSLTTPPTSGLTTTAQARRQAP